MSLDVSRKDPDAPVWFITGCSTLFGRELASAVLARGYRAVVTARDPDSVSALAEPYGNQALTLALDVTDAQEVRAAVDVAATHDGPHRCSGE